MISFIDDFLLIREDWERLYCPEYHTVFQSYEYNFIFWRHHENSGQLALLIYRDGNNTIQAILPTYIKNKELHFINDRGTDFCDIVYNRSISLLGMMTELIEFINDSVNEIKLVEFMNIRGDSPLLRYLKVLAPSSFVFSLNEYSYLKCIQSADPISSFTHLPSERRRKLKKILEKSRQFGFLIYNIKNSKDFPENDLRFLANNMVETGSRKLESYNETFWNYIIESYNAGLIDVAILYSPERTPVSAGIVFVNSHISVRWRILYIDKKYNIWNNVRYIQEKAQLTSYENNFGRGGYDYKIWNFYPELDALYKVLIPISTSRYWRVCFDSFIYYAKRVTKRTKLYQLIARVRGHLSH